jgi:hydroxypyruvate reductase
MTEKLRRDAIAIWRAGLAAVDSVRLVRDAVRVEGRWLEVGHATACQRFDLDAIGRIVVVGAGKAGAGMATGLEAALGPQMAREKQLAGWINVPADCLRKLAHIHLHAARPAGVNEPTQAGLEGARAIMRLAGALAPGDLCIALVSGGGSALLPLPLEGITLEDKLSVTRLLSAAGAPIEELNTVRKSLSQIKGGGLARACRADNLVTLVISDILGDPLDLIASGPTIESDATPERALEILDRYGAAQAGISDRVFAALARHEQRPQPARNCRVANLVIGNNAVAVAAAQGRATELGYAASGVSAQAPEGPAEDVGTQLAETSLAMRGRAASCLVSGGEPTVKLAPEEQRGLGGRNQQLVLAAAARLKGEDAGSFLILSGGTDGEDGPTDAAGAWLDGEILREAGRRNLDPGAYLARNDAYRWFEPLGALLKTGPTHTNVCDVRVVLVGG